MQELTLRGFIIASILTIIFTAANIYFGLRSGLTFTTSIPAAIISMSLLHFFKKANVLENCTIQTFASAAGTLTVIVCVLPSMIMIGYWVSFSYWQTLFICLIGGAIGVLFTVPLRRGLIVESDLPYPEGVAAAKILEIGNQVKNEENNLIQDNAKAIWHGAILSALISLFSAGFGIMAQSFKWFFKAGGMIFGFSCDYSLSLLGAGYLMGIRSAIALLIGVTIGLAFIVPYFSSFQLISNTDVLSDIVYQLWSHQVRFIGIGSMIISSIWTLISLCPVIYRSIVSNLKDWQQQKNNQKILPRTERDIPIKIVMITSLLLSIPIFLLFLYFIFNANLKLAILSALILALLATLFVLITGLLIAIVSGYLAGMVGSSCSPLSGVSIVSILLSGILLNYFFNHLAPDLILNDKIKSIMAFTIFIGSFSISISAIANDNLQDLKTGQMVGATPWRQQLALLFGVTVGALVTPLIMDLVYQAYGFASLPMPRPGMDPKIALLAPQANMITELVRAIFMQNIKWHLLITGAVISAAFILIDQLICKPLAWPRLSVLAISIGLYFPSNIVITMIFGGIINHLVKSKLSTNHQANFYIKEQRGICLASGFLIGETLVGILLALLILISGNSHPLMLVGSGFSLIAAIVGFIMFMWICWYLYHF